MSASLLGFPLEQALRELAERGMTRVAVNRLLAPGQASDPDRSEWRVVRMNGNEGEAITLDICCFKFPAE